MVNGQWSMVKEKKYLLSELSVFYPCYNVEKIIPKVFEKTVRVLKGMTPKWEIVLIEDGSQDNTKMVLKRLQRKYPNNVRVIYHSKNWGYGGTIKQGFYESKYQWIAFTDSDGQFDFDEIIKLIKAQKGQNVKVVLGYRIKRRDPQVRQIIATLLKLWNFIFFGFKGVRDVDCGFKLFSKEVIDKIGKLKTDSAITSTELLIKTQRLGYKWVQVGVHHYERRYGKQTGSSFGVMKRAAIDSINLWKALR